MSGKCWLFVAYVLVSHYGLVIVVSQVCPRIIVRKCKEGLGGRVVWWTWSLRNHKPSRIVLGNSSPVSLRGFEE